MRKEMAIVVALGIVFFPARAKVGKVQYEKIELSEVIRRSSLIVVAQPVEPFEEQKKINLGPGVKPYGYTLFRYRVLDCVQPKEGLEHGATVIVSSFKEDSLSGHIDYYVFGRSTGQVSQIYDGSGKISKDTSSPVILFLKRSIYLEYDETQKKLLGNPDTFALAFDGAIESIAKKNEISAQVTNNIDRTIKIIVGAKEDTQALTDHIPDIISKEFQGESNIDYQIIKTYYSTQRR